MVILLSGVSSGIGRCLTERLLAAGHSVWGISRTGGGDLRHADFHSAVCDVAVWDQVSRLADTIATGSGFTGFDAIIHCAAMQGPAGPGLAADPTAWSDCIRVNLDGTYFVLRAFVPLLRRSPGSRRKVICFSGGGASQARPNFSAYSASKTGVVRLVETLAEEWREEAIDLNAIAPGTLPTRMTDEVIRAGTEVAGEAEVASARRTLAGGHAGFDRLGDLIEFLLSADSDGVTGKLISAQWDPWERLPDFRDRLQASDIFTLRRVTPEDRGETWN